MTMKLQKDVNSLVLRFGVALALSFAGFLYSRNRIKLIRPSLPPPPSSRSSDVIERVDSEDGSGIDEDIDTYATPRRPECGEISSSLTEGYEQPYLKTRVGISSLNSSPITKYRVNGDMLLLPEFNSLVKDFYMSTIGGDLTIPILNRDHMTSMSNDDTPEFTKCVERYEDEQEIQNLRSMVGSLRERVRYLEIQLLEYHGLREQESAIMELQKQLKINNVEAKLLSLKIDSLQADNRRLQAQVADYSKVVAELEDAKLNINMLKRKLKSEAERNKEQILSLKQRVTSMQLQEQDMHKAGGSGMTTSIDPDVESTLQKIEDLEIEIEDLKKSNYELQIENSELARKLESAQILATSILEHSKIEDLGTEARLLKEENENLTKEVERLQSVRYADVEELVYLRWVNACLRYELRNYQPPPGRTVARDLSRSLSPTSEKEAKKLILEYANTEENGDKCASLLDLDYDQWFSSQSYNTDSGEADNSSIDQPSQTKTQKKKKKFFGKLRRLITGKDSPLRTKSLAMARTRSVEDLEKSYSHDLAHHSSQVEVGNDESIDPCSPRSLKFFRGSQRSSVKLNRCMSFSIEEVEDIESMNRSWTPSQNSSRSSLELNRVTSLTEADAKDMESANRSSCGSSYSYKRLDLAGREITSTSPSVSQPDRSSRKSDLAKYAEALKESPWTRRGHRKSASLA